MTVKVETQMGTTGSKNAENIYGSEVRDNRLIDYIWVH